MAYTTTQLQTFFANANAGTAPSAAQTLTLTALANQNAAGTLTDAQALAQTIDLASDITTAVSVETYAFFTGVAPSQDGLKFLNAAFVGTGAQANLNGENRFIAQSVALALGNAAAKTSFSASYGSLSVADATKAAYNIIIGNAAAAAAGINVDSAVGFLTSASSIAYYTSYVKANLPATTSAADLDLAVKAAIVGEIMYLATTYNNGAGVGSYAAAANNLIKDLADDGVLTANNTAGINLFTAYGASGSGTPGTPGQAFALKVGLDALIGTANDDTFVGSLDALGATATTVNLGDSIDGGSGTDTLTVVSNITGGTSVSGLTLKSVENVVVNNTVAAGAGNLITVDASGFSGVSKISAGGTGNLTVTNIGSVTLGALNTTTNGTVGDATPTANTIVTQTITGAGATSVDVSGNTQNTFGNLAIDTSGGTGTSLTLRNTGSAAATVSTLKVGSAVATLNVAATSAITLNGTYSNTVFANNGASTRDGVGIVETTANTLATVNVTGVGAVSLGTIGSTALKTVDASASTGGLTATLASSALTSVKGSSAADTLTLTGTLGATAVVDLGAGADTLVLSNAPTAGATINGGDGTDTLGLNAAGIVTAGNKAQFVSFENAAINGANYDVGVLTSFANINVTGGTVVLTGIGANATFNATTGTTALTTTLTTATGTSDVINLNLGTAGKGGATVTGYTAAGVETVNINSLAGTSTSTNSLTFGAGSDALKQVNVTGNGTVTVNAAAITSGTIGIDASANTGGLTATGSTTKITNIIGTAANDTITAGGAGGTINAGKGGDAVTLGAGNDIVNLKAGDSTFDATNAAGVGNKGTMDTITGFNGAGVDKLDLTQIAGFVGSAQGVANATVADIAAVGTYLTSTANLFKDGGGLVRGVLDIQLTGTATTHFVVVDVNHDGAYTAGTDMVVQLVTGPGTALVATDFNFGS
jgi:S-layer protein